MTHCTILYYAVQCSTVIEEKNERITDKGGNGMSDFTAFCSAEVEVKQRGESAVLMIGVKRLWLSEAWHSTAHNSMHTVVYAFLSSDFLRKAYTNTQPLPLACRSIEQNQLKLQPSLIHQISSHLISFMKLYHTVSYITYSYIHTLYSIH